MPAARIPRSVPPARPIARTPKRDPPARPIQNIMHAPRSATCARKGFRGFSKVTHSLGSRNLRAQRVLFTFAAWIAPGPQQVGFSVIPAGSRLPALTPVILALTPVIPAKAGIFRCAIWTHRMESCRPQPSCRKSKRNHAKISPRRTRLTHARRMPYAT